MAKSFCLWEPESSVFAPALSLSKERRVAFEFCRRVYASLLFLFFTLRTPEFEMALLASAVDAFRASGVTPATTAAVLFATRGLLDQGSESADAAGEASSADASSTKPSVAIASLVRALGEDLTSTDDTRRAGSTQLLSEVCEEGGA